MSGKGKTQPAPAEDRRRQPADGGGEAAPWIRRHLRFGWWSLLLFLTLGILLEGLHGFKVGWYLNVSTEARRLMWRLAHAHGTLLGLLHLAFAATVHLLPDLDARARRWASRGLIGASIFLPGGFFAGGVVLHGADPGLGILLVPVGAISLFAAVLAAARGVNK